MGVHVDDFEGDNAVVDLIIPNARWNWSVEHPESKFRGPRRSD